MLPFQITFRGLEPSEAITARARELASKLAHVYDRVLRCKVVVETSHHHVTPHHRVHVAITLPGEELVVDREAGSASDEDVYTALVHAFHAVKRRLVADRSRHRLSAARRHGSARVTIRGG